MFVETGRSQNQICPKCRHSLRLHARLPQADGFPEVQCLECTGCGDVIVVEQFVPSSRPLEGRCEISVGPVDSSHP